LCQGDAFEETGDRQLRFDLKQLPRDCACAILLIELDACNDEHPQGDGKAPVPRVRLFGPLHGQKIILVGDRHQRTLCVLALPGLHNDALTFQSTIGGCLRVRKAGGLQEVSHKMPAAT
jgi:hypothetical protein